MAYKLFEKTQIASYTDISALMCVIDDEGPDDQFWKYSLYGNLCWEKNTATLYHCGKYDHFSYKEYENENRIILEKLPQSTGDGVIKSYLDNGFYILLPINTKTLGYTEIEFKHNVFITGYDEDKFIVFDYWTPGFTWRYESLEYERIMSSIDFSNPETVQMIYAFRKNTDMPQKEHEIAISDVTELYSKQWSDNPQYDCSMNIYGTDVYAAMAERIKETDKLRLIDCQNFHVLWDHLQFTKNTYQRLFATLDITAELMSKLDEMIFKANAIRNTAYKYYVAGRCIDRKRDFFVEELNELFVQEKSLREKITEVAGG